MPLDTIDTRFNLDVLSAVHHVLWWSMRVLHARARVVWECAPVNVFARVCVFWGLRVNQLCSQNAQCDSVPGAGERHAG